MCNSVPERDFSFPMCNTVTYFGVTQWILIKYWAICPVAWNIYKGWLVFCIAKDSLAIRHWPKPVLKIMVCYQLKPRFCTYNIQCWLGRGREAEGISNALLEIIPICTLLSLNPQQNGGLNWFI